MQIAKEKPLYRIVFEELKHRIDTGHYKKNDLLPSENELCKAYSTTRPTVRQALTELARLGYIHRQHGKGSIVSEPKNGLGILSLKGATAGVGKKNLRTAVITKARKTAWPTDFPFDLEEKEKAAGAIYLSRLRYINERPVLFEETYITDIQLSRFTTHNFEKRSLFDTLRSFHQVEVKEGEQRIWAIQADKTLADLLDTKLNRPVLHMKRRLKTSVNGLYIYSFLYCNTEEYFVQDYF